jgi:hypothetical protein
MAMPLTITIMIVRTQQQHGDFAGLSRATCRNLSVF